MPEINERKSEDSDCKFSFESSLFIARHPLKRSGRPFHLVIDIFQYFLYYVNVNNIRLTLAIEK
jgi:hypothetical protein